LATFFHTIRHIPLASATVIQYLSPIFTVLLARRFDGQQAMRPVQWGLFGLAFVGVLMVKGFDARVSWFYLALGVVSAASAGVAYLATMKCRDTDHPVGVVIWFHLVAVPVSGSLTAFTWVPPVGWEWGLALAVGLLSIVAQIAMTFALHQGQASTIMPFKYVGAVLAFLSGLFLFDERLNGYALVGIGLVIVAVTLNTLLKRRASPKAG
jgi:drug/metabolite transporter (DMT)-like permease